VALPAEPDPEPATTVTAEPAADTVVAPIKPPLLSVAVFTVAVEEDAEEDASENAATPVVEPFSDPPATTVTATAA
jgi:hypothetical protein